MKQKIKEKVLKTILWLKDQCGDRRTVILYFIVWAVLYSPVLVGYPLYFLFGWRWCLIMASTYFIFWAGPFTPFLPLCVAITLFLKRIIWKEKKADAPETELSVQQMSVKEDQSGKAVGGW